MYDPHTNSFVLEIHLHLVINHEVEAVQVVVADLAVQTCFYTVEAVRHYLLDSILKFHLKNDLNYKQRVAKLKQF